MIDKWFVNDPAEAESDSADADSSPQDIQDKQEE